jgi:hypothetical protein
VDDDDDDASKHTKNSDYVKELVNYRFTYLHNLFLNKNKVGEEFLKKYVRSVFVYEFFFCSIERNTKTRK